MLTMTRPPQTLVDETVCLETLVEKYRTIRDEYRAAAENYVHARIRPSADRAPRVSLDSMPLLEEVNRLAGELADLELAIAAAGGRMNRRRDSTIHIYGYGALLTIV